MKKRKKNKYCEPQSPVFEKIVRSILIHLHIKICSILKIFDKTKKLAFYLVAWIMILMTVYAIAVDAVAITEIMYNPEGSDNNKEFVEIYHEKWVNLTGYVIHDESSSDVLEMVNYYDSKYSLIVEQDFNFTGINATVYSVGATIGNSLNNKGEKISLFDCSNDLVYETEYTNEFGNNNGHSIEFSDGLWVESIVINGTPGYEIRNINFSSSLNQNSSISKDNNTTNINSTINSIGNKTKVLKNETETNQKDKNQDDYSSKENEDKKEESEDLMSKCDCSEYFRMEEESKQGRVNFEIIDMLNIINQGDNLNIKLKIESDNREHVIEIWSYVYKGNKKFTNMKQNLRKIIIGKWGVTGVALKNEISDLFPGEYNLKIVYTIDGKKEEINEIIEIKKTKQATISEISQNLEMKNAKNKEKTETFAEIVPENSNNYKSESGNGYNDEAINEEQKIVYRSKSLASNELAVYFIIGLFVLISGCLICFRT